MGRLRTSLRRWTDHPAAALAITGGVLVILLCLAVVQYRWIGQVSEAERERLQAGLESATLRFAGDFNGEFVRILQALNPGGPRFAPQAAEEYAERFARWKEESAFPGLVKDLIWRQGLSSGNSRKQAPASFRARGRTGWRG